MNGVLQVVVLAPSSACIDVLVFVVDEEELPWDDGVVGTVIVSSSSSSFSL
jgi:hypothetical protein